jgi:hypothetical protein
MSIRDITREMCNQADIIYFSRESSASRAAAALRYLTGPTMSA